MVTITPANRNQVVLAVRAGFLPSEPYTIEDTINSMFDLSKDRDHPSLPDPKTTAEYIAKDLALAAQYFIEISDAVTRQVFGWDNELHKPTPEGGLKSISTKMAKKPVFGDKLPKNMPIKEAVLWHVKAKVRKFISLRKAC
jgi:hypothetical protein